METVLIIMVLSTAVLAAALAAVAIMCIQLVKDKLPKREGMFIREMLEVMIGAWNQGRSDPKLPVRVGPMTEWEFEDNGNTAKDPDKIPDEVTLDA